MLSGCRSGKTVSIIDWGFQFQIAKKKIEDLILLVAGKHQPSTPVTVCAQAGCWVRRSFVPLLWTPQEEIAECYLKRLYLKKHQTFEYLLKLYREERTRCLSCRIRFFSRLTKFLLSFIHTRFLLGLYFETLSSGDAFRWDTGGEGDCPSSFKSQRFKSDLVLIWGKVLILRLDAVCS